MPHDARSSLLTTTHPSAPPLLERSADYPLIIPQRIDIPIAPPPTDSERRAVAYQLSFLRRARAGPLYCDIDPTWPISTPNMNANINSSDDTRKRKKPQTAAELATAHFDAFDDQPTYAQKYKKARFALPRLRDGVFVKGLFPAELWGVIDPAAKTKKKKGAGAGAGAGAGSAGKKRKNLDTFLANNDVYDYDPDKVGDEDGGQGEENDEKKGKEDNEDEDDKDPDAENEDEVEGDEDADPDQFDEDDDDDYNGEKYFDDGADDDYGDEGGGGGGGGGGGEDEGF